MLSGCGRIRTNLTSTTTSKAEIERLGATTAAVTVERLNLNAFGYN